LVLDQLDFNNKKEKQMKKIIGLIITLLLVTGCEAIYTIEINGDTFKETLEINNRDSSTWTLGGDEVTYEQAIRDTAKFFVPIDIRFEVEDEPVEGVEYYNIELIDTAQNLGLKFSHDFDGFEEYRESTIVNSNMPGFQIFNTGTRLGLNSGSNNYSFGAYGDLTKLTVRVVVNQEIVEHNADEIIGGVLYWHLTRDNYEGKEMNVILGAPSLSQPDLWQTDDEGFLGTNSLIAIYILIGAFLIIGACIVYVKVANSNR
jgi:hypothetical protein